jgi:hypothetical protein
VPLEYSIAWLICTGAPSRAKVASITGAGPAVVSRLLAGLGPHRVIAVMDDLLELAGWAGEVAGDVLRAVR